MAKVLEGNKNKTEAVRVDDTKKFAETYAALPAEKKSIVIAFLNGMEMQKSIDEARA